MATVGAAVTVPGPPAPTPAVVADVAATVAAADVAGGDGFFPAEQPKMSLKSKYGGLPDAAGICGGFCAVKSVIARRKLHGRRRLTDSGARRNDNTRARNLTSSSTLQTRPSSPATDDPSRTRSLYTIQGVRVARPAAAVVAAAEGRAMPATG